MKRIVAVVLLLFCFSTVSYAAGSDSDLVMKEQKEDLNISGFVNEAKKYSSEFLDGMDIDELLSSAIKGEVDNASLFKRVLNSFGKEIKDSITVLRKYYHYYCYS